jgi:hypothetical protein
MKKKIPAGKTRLLLVEGKEDKEFFIRLGSHLQFTDAVPLEIIQYEGESNLETILKLIRLDPNFKNITHIGIVRDADYEINAFTRVQQALMASNQEKVDAPLYSIPTQARQFTTDTPSTGILILPEGTEGMLEDILLAAFADDPALQCVDIFFECVGQFGQLVRERMPKARVRALITAKNVDRLQSSGSDVNKGYLSDIFAMSWWNDDRWNHPVFDQVRSFLLHLAT